MIRPVLVLVLVLGCGKKAEQPKDAAVRPIDAPAADAAVPLDAPIAVEKVVPKKLAIGPGATCAVMSDKSLRCWGKNDHGQLGDGTQTDRDTPVTPPLRGVDEVVFGAAHACALLDDGSVACWGDIGFGKPGPTLEPAGVPGVTNALRVFARGQGACATVKTGALICWGDVDAKGHIRRAGKPEHRVPTPAVGIDHVLALSDSGALREDGALYFTTEAGEFLATGLSGFEEIGSRDDTVCGRTQKGVIQCAGVIARCEKAVIQPPAPKVEKPAKPTKPAKPVKTAKKAGKGGKAGKPAKAQAPAPPPAFELEQLALAPASHLAFDRDFCTITTGGQVQCLDPRDKCHPLRPGGGLPKLVAMHAGCMQSTAGEILCNTQKGFGTLAKGASTFVANNDHGCAIVGEGVVCWPTGATEAMRVEL